MNLRHSNATLNPFLITFLGVLSSILLTNNHLLFHQEFWAEDGTEWFLDAYQVGGFEPFKDLYGNYAQLFPRLIAAILVPVLPLSLLPKAFVIVSLSINCLAFSMLSLPHFRWFIRSDLVRSTLCITAALAHPGLECIGNLTNVHWFLAVGALLITNIETTSQPFRIIGCFWIVFAGLSSPATLFLLPLVVLGLLYRRARLFQVIYFLSVATSVVIWLCFADTNASKGAFNIELLYRTIDFLRVSLLLALFNYKGAYEIKALPIELEISVIATLLILALLLSSRSWKISFLSFGIAAAAVAAYGFATLKLRSNLFINGVDSVFLEFPKPNYWLYNHSRYLLVPFFIWHTWLFWLFAEYLSTIRRWLRFSVAFVTIGLLPIVLRNSWGPVPDLHWLKYATAIESGWSGIIPIHPTSYSWKIEIPGTRDGTPLQELIGVPNAYRGIRVIKHREDYKEALFLHPPEIAAANLLVTDKYFVFYYGLDSHVIGLSDGVRFVARIKSESKPVFDETVRPTNAVNGALRLGVIDLSRFFGEKIEITLQTKPAGNGGYDWALWVDPHFTSIIPE